MTNRRVWSAVIMFAAVALAGCADSSEPDVPVDETAFEGLEGEATATTGILRGVVVDDAIRPIAGASVTLQGQETSQETTASGAFLFSGLEPGTYFLRVEKLGYTAVQQSADVAAGVAEPAAVKVLMEVDPENRPYVQAFVFEGFLECSVTAVAVGWAVCSTAGAANDKFAEIYELEGTPAFAQSELVWTSTQALGDELEISYSWDCGGTFLCDYSAAGQSPVILSADGEAIETIGLGENPLWIRVFNTGLSLTQPEGVPGAGVGATVQQEFTVYTHVFYGFEPDPGWTFVASGAPTVPE